MVSDILDLIGVGIDTARYGHRVRFLRPDLQAAAKPLTVTENRAGYEQLRQALESLQRQHPQAHFQVRIDAAGQYAVNLEKFLRSFPGPLTISVGEPKRNKDYHRAHFPKRASDDTESLAMARFAVVEQPKATAPIPTEMQLLRDVAGRLQTQSKQTTRTINQLHNLLSRVFPELATLTKDVSTGWVLKLLDKYPSAARIAAARLPSLQKIPFLPHGKAEAIQEAARRSVASLHGELAENLVRDLVGEVRHAKARQRQWKKRLAAVYAALPDSGHIHLTTIPGVGPILAAALVAKIVDIDRFEGPEHLVGYFGIFSGEESSGVDKEGRPLPSTRQRMSPKGNDLVRGLLWNAAKSAIRHNPAVRALYRRLRSRGKRGDVSLGHCMRKLLHLVFAIWKTKTPFDPCHFPWENPEAENTAPTAGAATPTQTDSDNKKAVGHKREDPAQPVVTTAPSTVNSDPVLVNQTASPAEFRPSIDFAFLRSQVTMERVLRHLGILDQCRARGPQLRGPCPLHKPTHSRSHTFSVSLQKNICQCFYAGCGLHGNVLDLWAAVQRLPLYEAALNFAETFGIPRNREEEHVKEPVAK